MEKPTTDEVGSDDLEVDAKPASPAAGRSKDAHDFLRTGGADAGVGADVDPGASAGVGTVEADTVEGDMGTAVSREEVGITTEGSGMSVGGTSWAARRATTFVVGSHDSDLDLTWEWAVPAAETEVFEERGEAGTGGVSDAVETSVSEEETVSGKSLRGDSAGSEAGFGGSSGAACVDEGSGGEMGLAPDGVAKGATSASFGDSGGVESRRALSRTSGGGRERGEIMMPGAREGFVGRRDQIAQPPNCCCFGFDDVLCIFMAAAAGGTSNWGVDGSDPEAWLEREVGIDEEGQTRGDGEESGVGSFSSGSGKGSLGGSRDSVDSSFGSGSSGPPSILGGFGEGVMGDSAGGGGIESCFGKGDIGCWNVQFCW